jgi:hypothetical protein
MLEDSETMEKPALDITGTFQRYRRDLVQAGII